MEWIIYHRNEYNFLFYWYQVQYNLIYGIQVVHRDLALRNLLLNGHHKIKISDFGLSRLVKYYATNVNKKQLPWKWMALESIRDRKFTSKSDV